MGNQLIIGGDVVLYRGGADVLQTGDSFMVANPNTTSYHAGFANAGTNYIGIILRKDGVAHAGFRWNGSVLEIMNASAQAYNPDNWTGGITVKLVGSSSSNPLMFGDDVSLYRAGTDILKTDDNFDALALRIGGTEVITSGRVLQNIASVAQTLLPSSDNAYDLGSESYRRRNIYDVSVYADGISVPNKAPIVWDDTQKSVSGTTETEVKNFRFAKNSAVRAWSKLYVLASLWVSGGTGHLKIYVDGETSPRLDLSTTSTSVRYQGT